MCLAIPMKIVRLMPDNKAIVSRGGVNFEADISLLDGPAEGDYTIVHAGFALEIMDSAEAREQDFLLQDLASPEAMKDWESAGDE